MTNLLSSRSAERHKLSASTIEVPNGISTKSLRGKGYTKAPKYRENQLTFDSFANMRLMRPTKTKKGHSLTSGGDSGAEAIGLHEPACLPVVQGPSRQCPTVSEGDKTRSSYVNYVCPQISLYATPLESSSIHTATDRLFETSSPSPENKRVALEHRPMSRKPSGQPSLIADTQGMYACLKSFEGALGKLESSVHNHSFRADLETPLFDKALFYSASNFAYTSHFTRPHPDLQEMSRKFFMMRQERCGVGYKLFLDDCDPTVVKEISYFIEKARSALDLLCRYNSDFATGLRMIQGALDLYLKKIQDLHTDRSNSHVAPCLLPGPRFPPTPPSMSRSTSQNEVGYKSPLLVQPSSSARKSTDFRICALPGPLLMLQLGTPEAKAATLTLSGWIYLGQTITQDFGVYFRVFIMLVRAIQL